MEDGNLVDMEVDVEWPPHPLTSLVNQGVELLVTGTYELCRQKLNFMKFNSIQFDGFFSYYDIYDCTFHFHP